jgi:acetylornithine deacetylase/succinyl-diaminopimelate desuccinylase-like protein
LTRPKAVRLLLLILLGALAALVVQQAIRVSKEDEEDKAQFIPRPVVVTRDVRLLQQYVAIDTSNPPGNETAGAQFLIRQIRAAGVPAELIESAPGRGNVYARLRGKHAGNALLLMSHIDVVPAPASGWRFPPFSGTIKYNEMYGRGTLDMKGIGICELRAFLDVATRGTTPEHDLVFLAAADEEQGSRFGVPWLLAQRPDIIDGVRYAINEGGVTETSGDQVAYFGIELGSKQVVKLRGHAADRERLQRFRRELEPFFAPRDPDRVLPEVREFFHAIAPHRLEARAVLIDIDQTIAQGKFWLLPQGMRELTYNMAWAEGISPSEAGGYEMTLSLLNLPDEDPAPRIASVKEKALVAGVGLEILDVAGPAPLTATDTLFYRMLVEAAQGAFGPIDVGPEVLNGGMTDSRFLRARGIAAYGFWPFPVGFYEADGIHGLNERVRVDWYEAGVELMRRLVTRYAYEKLPEPENRAATQTGAVR